MNIVPATSEALIKFYEFRPSASCYAYMAVEDGEVYGVCGFYSVTSGVMMFAGLTDRLRECPLIIYKAAKKVLEIAMTKGVPVYAEADLNIEPSTRFLERLGFERLSKEVFVVIRNVRASSR
jgi:hypothetical protein